MENNWKTHHYLLLIAEIIAIIFGLIGISMVGKAQTIHRDTTLNGISYCNISATDSNSSFYNVPLKLHIDLTDQCDNVNGAIFNYTMYSRNPLRISIISSGSVPLKGKSYDSWDANSDDYMYSFVRSALATQGVYITFEK